VTHLVATLAQYSKNGAKVKEAAKFPDIKIVDFKWLDKCLASKLAVSEDGHLLDPNQDDDGNASDTICAASTTTTSRKRQRPADDDEDDVNIPAPTDLKKSKVMQKDGQIAKSRSVNIPVDEHCPSKNKYKVYIDDDGMIFDATLNQTNSGNNNNKFYRLQLLSDDGEYYTWTRWGRVGNSGQSKMLGDGSLDTALNFFHDKFKGMCISSRPGLFGPPSAQARIWTMTD
jgi:poly [ADP-ribose] polymerase